MITVVTTIDNDREAHKLLDLINAEFQSDPMSVQCFDLSIVTRVKECVEREKKLG
jgi:predicted LPLAT superfamily acyltransferase